MGSVRLGTSGFSFNDWKGVFYPDSTRKSEWFSYYVDYFTTTEINSTYYRIPPKRTFAVLEEKTSDDFEFIVKVNNETTHLRKKSAEAMSALHDALEPVASKGKLHGLLAQFPYNFRNAGENRRYLLKLKEDCRDVPLFVEFRHASWNHPAVFDFLNDSGACYCCVDEPPLKGLITPQAAATGDTGYVRFHGRNSEAWWDSSKGDRYDYLYTADELFDWIERIRAINRKTSKTYLFFNNCHAGHAVKNAKMMAELLKKQLNIDTVLKDIPIERSEL
ncbi:DUF72 domain-containing protein [candidate division KSB1 bacterium]